MIDLVCGCCDTVGFLLNNQEYFRCASIMLESYLKIVFICVFLSHIFCICKVGGSLIMVDCNNRQLVVENSSANIRG